MSKAKKKQIKAIKLQIKKTQKELQRRDRKPLFGFKIHRLLLKRELEKLQKELKRLQSEDTEDITDKS